MKQIYLTENQIKLLKEESDIRQINLPSFISKKVLSKTTSLGDNKAIPDEDDVPFLYKLLLRRYKVVTDNFANNLIMHSDINIESLRNHLDSLIIDVQKIERKNREQLEKICINTIVSLFKVPSDTIDIECNLVDKVDDNINVQTLPESNDIIKYEFNDTDDIKKMNEVVLKRRLIDSLIQGSSYNLSNIITLYENEINNIDKNLMIYYNDIKIINDYLLFVSEDKIDEKKPVQGSYVEVRVGSIEQMPSIASYGIIFPYLLNETIRGFMELFASHGLPDDINKANYILRQADFLLAEPFDLRMGVGLWDIIKPEDTSVIPYFFTKLCEMDVKKFNYSVKNILSKTKKGKSIKEKLIRLSKHELDYNEFNNDMMQKQNLTSVITDGYFDINDIDSLQINEENDSEYDNDIIDLIINSSENDIDFNPIIKDGFLNSKTSMMYNMEVIIDNRPIDIDYIDFNINAKKIGYSKEIVYEPHIAINPSLRRNGIAYKIYARFIDLYGNIYHSYNRVVSPIEISGLWEKLSERFKLIKIDDKSEILVK